ncbi:hypothetical protein [Hymenobacter armeniacus]|uniref:Uncharacterized protein n=1 Tax=Hymenobacter armeniacus TaxID=2771358 RepID=A0ABR8JSZ0_9BACT|nr:hypothetical protein [Hymenobacter armeniacus]MBD2720804.1 hypothetical protein [Hymenobacter armeniacus]
MLTSSAFLGFFGRIVDPLMKLFMKRYNQPKLYMKVVFKEKYIKAESKYYNPPCDYTLYREYEVTVRNNSEHNAYLIMIRAPKEVGVHSINPPREYHQPLLVHEEFIYRHQLRKPFYGTQEEAEVALKKWVPNNMRLEYENVSGQSFFTEFVFGRGMETQNQFGAFKNKIKNQ